MDELNLRIDINQASQAELCQVPGIGRNLADRIINGRPYEKLDDLLRLKGVHANQLEKWTAFLSVYSSPDLVESAGAAEPEVPTDRAASEAEAIPEKLEDSSTVVGETQVPAEKPEDEPIKEDATQKTIAGLFKNMETPRKVGRFVSEFPEQLRQRMDQSQPFSQVEAMVWGGGIALLVLILSVCFAMGILAGINGSLSYVPSARFTELQSQVTILNMQIKQVQLDTDSLRERLNALEGLSGRVTAVEKENKDLKTQISTNAEQIQSISDQLKQLQSEITTLKERNQAYDQFLSGLKTLLDNVVLKTAQ